VSSRRRPLAAHADCNGWHRREGRELVSAADGGKTIYVMGLPPFGADFAASAAGA